MPVGFVPPVAAREPSYVPPPPGYQPYVESTAPLAVRPMPQLPPPPGYHVAPPPPAAPRSRKKAWAIAAGTLGVVGLGAAIAASRGHEVTAKDAIVRVTTSSGMGAGFFVEGPDRYAYVATANHVVDRGERVLVERDVGTDKDAFVEAYPETEIVATDPDADLAIIRIKNVDASRFSHLTLAKEPDEGREDPVVRLSRLEPGQARRPRQQGRQGALARVVPGVRRALRARAARQRGRRPADLDRRSSPACRAARRSTTPARSSAST